MEGGIHPADASTFRECLGLARKNPYVLRLAFSAGLGGLLFGYDTGVISGALLYIRDDFKSVDRSTFLQESIVSMALAGAIVGASVGGWINDRFGRRKSLLLADFLFLGGAIIMASAPNPAALIVGRVFVGFGVGMASMSSPLYISEASPANIRGALVSTNGFLITGGQFLSYCINLAFTEVTGTWRWMLGIAGIPALLQLILMFFLPESPRWLYRKGREAEAEEIIRKLYPAEQVDVEMLSLKESVESETEGGKGEKIGCMDLLKTKTIRRGLIAGVGLQVFQQFVGINTVMYYSATIIQFAGYASNQTALLLSLLTSGLNAGGSILSIFFIDRTGRKKLLIFSLIGVIVALGFLSAIFNEATSHSSLVSPLETKHFSNFTCPAYSPATTSRWSCTTCLKANCGFCSAASGKLKPGACLSGEYAVSKLVKNTCTGEAGREWYTRGCPSSYGWLALLGLALYIVFFSPGMGTVPWIVNSEIYPLRYRGVCGGIAATGNWVSNLIVAQTFLSLTQAIGTSWAFFVFGVISVMALFFVIICVPETKNMPIEEIEKMLEGRNMNFMFWKKRAASEPQPADKP